MIKQAEEVKLRLENELVEIAIRELEGCTASVELDDLLSRVSLEWSLVCEQVRDKLINDEIAAPLIGQLSLEVIDEVRRDQEREWRLHVLRLLEDELVEKFMTTTVDVLSRECCERVVWEHRTVQAQSIFVHLLDEVS